MRVMVLGGGNCQLNLIKRLKAQGDFVILIDYLDDCPARCLCDLHLLISTFDIDKVMKAATDNKIETIVTIGTDQPILTAATVAEKLGLSFYIDSNQALKATNKRVMKKLFEENAIPNVKYKLIDENFSENDIRGIEFPAVLKPVDSQGQRGIFKGNSLNEIREYISKTISYSREDYVLLEEYYDNDEITVNGYLIDGKFTLLSVVDRVTMVRDNRIGICIAHNFPSLHLKENYNEILHITNKIIRTFGFKNGPVYFQYLIGKNGIKVNEIAMRIGGAYEDVTIPIISGIDMLGLLINDVKGKKNLSRKLETYNITENNKYVSTQLFFCKKGKINFLSDTHTIKKLNGVEDIFYNVKIGDEMGAINNATARAGYMIITGYSFEDMMSNVDNAFENLVILDEDGNSLVIKYSDYENKYSFIRQ